MRIAAEPATAARQQASDAGAVPDLESLVRSDPAAGGVRRRHGGRTIAAVLGDLGRDSDFGDLATRGRAESAVLKLLTVPARRCTRFVKKILIYPNECVVPPSRTGNDRPGGRLCAAGRR
jgi:hypothetical protein